MYKIAHQPQDSRTEPQGSEPQNSAKRPSWPDDVRRWVSRALDDDNAVRGVTKDEVSIKLRIILSDVQGTPLLYETDWDNHPLPQKIILQERAQAIRRSNGNGNPHGNGYSHSQPQVHNVSSGYQSLANGSYYGHQSQAINGYPGPQGNVPNSYFGPSDNVNTAYSGHQPQASNASSDYQGIVNHPSSGPLGQYNNAYTNPQAQFNSAYSSPQVSVNNSYYNSQLQANSAYSDQEPQSNRSHPNNVPSKKRKSGSQSSDSHGAETWRNGAKVTKTGHKDTNTGHKSKKQEKRERQRQRQRATDKLWASSKYQEDLEKRRQRFDTGGSAMQSPKASSRADTPTTPAPIVGLSQALEKKYFRLTDQPKLEEVRPQVVLEKAMEHLKRKWEKERNYNFMCDQLKAVRQDFTVQHLKNSFTLEVYEFHARIALEMSDLGEYKQCQTQLEGLYGMKLGGHPKEFFAYRLFYLLYTGNRHDLNHFMAEIEPEHKKDMAVQHALAVRSALARGEYGRFFRLYHNAPNLGGHLIKHFVNRERLAALTNLCVA